MFDLVKFVELIEVVDVNLNQILEGIVMFRIYLIGK